MKKIPALLFLSVLLFSLISCVSTDVYDNEEVSLVQNDYVLSTERTEAKNGKVKKNLSTTYSYSDEEEEFVDEGKISLQKVNEKVTVESKPNAKYITYSIFGKPFVILGCSIWELIKCGGYSFVNFLGGYNTFTGGETFWVMPDVKGNFAKCDEALEANRIKVYPEYHKPFTDNKISVSKITYEAETVTTDENEMAVTSKEEYEYDNTLSVEKSVSADANATFGVAGVVGSVITVPISAITWVFGAAYGIYSSVR